MKDTVHSIINSRKTGVIVSVVSLVLIMCLLVVATYSWVETGRESEVDSSNNLSFDVTPDLDITGKNVSNGKITIPNFELREVSSVDGRNVYVPDDSNNGNGDGITSTNELRFREANPADVYNGDTDNKPANMRYVAFSFYISSPSGEETEVYLAGNSSISGTGAEYVRMSIDTHDNNAPKVFSSAVEQGYLKTVQAVSSIDKEGVASTSTQKAEAFATYAYVGKANPLFILKANEKKLVTVTLWLEGASGDFPNSLDKSSISAHINIKTTQDYTNTIKVVDRTLGNWVHDNNSYLFVYDAASENISYKMDYDSSSKTWTANIPQSVTKVYFRRWNPEDASVKWNYWGEKEHPIILPGAKTLYNSGTETQKQKGLDLTYNLIGNYDSHLPNGEAGIWGEFDDSNFDSNFREIYFFDQSSSALDDTDGYFNGNITPFINMNVSYTYQGESVTTNLCYRMYKNYVGSRMYRQIMFIPPTGYTASPTFDSYTCTEDKEGNIIEIEKGSKSISADISSIGTKKFFAYCGSDATGNYWGSGMNYVVTNGDVYTNDNSAGAKYVMHFFDGTSGVSWKDMCRWSDTYTKYSDNKFPGNSNESFYAVVNPDNTSAIYCRMKYGTTNYYFDNNDDLWNRTGDCSISTTKDCKITGYDKVNKLNGKDSLVNTMASDWINLPDRPKS